MSTRPNPAPAPVDPAFGAATSSRSGQPSGPWSHAFWVLIPTRVRSKSNFRRRKGGVWEPYRLFEDEIAVEVRQHLPRGWVDDSSTAELRARPGYVAVIAAQTVIDAGNLPKSVLDACEGVVYTNDAQVQVVTSLTRRARRDPYLLVAFAQLEAGRGLSEYHIASRRLLDVCVEVLEPLA